LNRSSSVVFTDFHYLESRRSAIQNVIAPMQSADAAQ